MPPMITNLSVPVIVLDVDLCVVLEQKGCHECVAEPGSVKERCLVERGLQLCMNINTFVYSKLWEHILSKSASHLHKIL